MSKITKKELIDLLVTKTGKKKEEYEDLWSECAKEVDSRVKDTLAPEEKDKMTLGIFKAQVKRVLKSKAELFTGVICGVSDVLDFGANTAYKKHKEMYEEDPEQAILDGYVDAEGHPLFVKDGWKKGKKINLEEEKYRKVYLIAKKESDDDYRRATLTLNFDKINEEIPLFKKVAFQANLGAVSTEDNYVLFQAAVTEFETQDDKHINFIEIAKKYYKSELSKMSKLESHMEKKENDFDKLVITKGNVSRINIGERTNIVELDDVSIDFSDDEPTGLTCWAHKGLDINFSEMTPDLVVFGRLSYNETKEEYQINALSFYTDEIWINKPAKEITETNVKQQKEEKKEEKPTPIAVENDSEDTDIF